jgi:release factor glutamine methyltransferase
VERGRQSLDAAIVGADIDIVSNPRDAPTGPSPTDVTILGMASAPGEIWTTRKLLRWTSEYLERKAIDAPKLSADLLLAHVLNTTRIKLYADLDRPASELERAAYRELVERAVRHEPVQYLIGEAHFFSNVFEVNSDVLIPRPSTEALVEHVIQHARQTPGFRQPLIADVGTGSGAIAISLAKHIEGANVIASDISDAAIEVAKRNAERNKVADRITFRGGDLFEPFTEAFEFVCSNPPYIPDNEWEAVASNVKDYEPHGALRGGADGLDVIRPLIVGSVERLAKPGQLVVEIAASQKRAVIELVEQTKGLANPRVLADAEGHPRVLIADRA